MKNNYMEKIFANRSVLAYFVALAVMFVAILFGLDFFLEAQAHAEATEQKIRTMQQATEAYDQKKVLLDQIPSKPVTNDKIDEVQTGILLQLQKHGLSLDNMSSVDNRDSQEKNQIFEMDLSGSYDHTMSFLSSFRSDAKALISVLSVHFVPEKEILKSTIKYKVYVR